MNLWLVIVIAGALTFATRLSFIILLDRIAVPSWFQRALHFVPVAVLSAFIFPELLQHTGTLELSLHNARLLSGVLAAGVAWQTKNVLLTIGVGLVTLWILQFVSGAP